MGFSVPALDAAAVNAGVDALLQQLAVWRQEDGAGLGAAEARRRMAFVGSATQPATAPLGVVEALHRALHASMAVVRLCGPPALTFCAHAQPDGWVDGSVGEWMGAQVCIGLRK